MAPRKTVKAQSAPKTVSPKQQAHAKLGSNISFEDDPGDEPSPILTKPPEEVSLERAMAIVAAARSRNGQAPIEPLETPNKVPPANPMTGHKRMRIMLEDSTDIPPNGLFLSHNGNTFMLKSSMEVSVPMPLIEILNNAVTSVPVVDPNTQRIIGYRKRLRFPYRVLNEYVPDAAA